MRAATGPDFPLSFRSSQFKVVDYGAALAARVREGRVDLVGVGRMHIANHDFVSKVRDGRFGDLTLFNKRRHLAEVMAAVEDSGVGLVEESRKVTPE